MTMDEEMDTSEPSNSAIDDTALPMKKIYFKFSPNLVDIRENLKTPANIVDSSLLELKTEAYTGTAKVYPSPQDPERQLEVVNVLLSQGDGNEKIRFVVNTDWWSQWRKWVKGSSKNAPGNVTNDLLLQDGRPVSDTYNLNDMKLGLKIDEDYILVSRQVWKALNGMNGERGTVIAVEIDESFQEAFPIYSIPDDPEWWRLDWDQEYRMMTKEGPANIMDVEDESNDILHDYRTRKLMLVTCMSCLSKPGKNS